MLLRFILNLCIPMLIVLLHTIIDHLEGDEIKVFKTADERRTKQFNHGSFWIAVARVGIPVVYILASLAIVLPGIINITISLS